MPKYEHEYTLEPGQIVKLNGIPYEYLGNGKVGGNTDLDAITPVPAGEKSVGGSHTIRQGG